jgi:hypothetical protein
MPQPHFSTAPDLSTPSPTATVLPLPVITLARFRRLMNYEGWDVDVGRMCVDTSYAYRCLALAHTSSDERLRVAALGLFDAYDRNTAVPLLH